VVSLIKVPFAEVSSTYTSISQSLLFVFIIIGQDSEYTTVFVGYGGMDVVVHGLFDLDCDGKLCIIEQLDNGDIDLGRPSQRILVESIAGFDVT